MLSQKILCEHEVTLSNQSTIFFIVSQLEVSSNLKVKSHSKNIRGATNQPIIALNGFQMEK